MAVATELFRAVWRMLVPSLYEQGFSFRGAMAVMRESYGPLRTATALTDWRSILGLIRGEYAARNVDPVKKFPQNKMIEADLGTSVRYRVYGWATYTDIMTGESVTKQISMYTNNWFSLEGWAHEFRRWKKKKLYEEGWELINVDMKVAEHNAGLSY